MLAKTKQKRHFARLLWKKCSQIWPKVTFSRTWMEIFIEHYLKLNCRDVFNGRRNIMSTVRSKNRTRWISDLYCPPKVTVHSLTISYKISRYARKLRFALINRAIGQQNMTENSISIALFVIEKQTVFCWQPFYRCTVTFGGQYKHVTYVTSIVSANLCIFSG